MIRLWKVELIIENDRGSGIMEYLKEYLKIIAYMLLGVVFSFSSFYLFVNIFHSMEIHKQYAININDIAIVNEYEQRLTNIETKLGTFDVNKYSGNISSAKMLLVQDNLKQCVTSMKNTYLENIKNNTQINVVDVYKLRESYENEVLSNCVVNRLYWALSPSENGIASASLQNNQTLIKMYVNTLKGETSYLKKDLLNNSSYYFNTSSANTGVKNDVRDGFYETMSAYSDASLYLEYLANWFNSEVGGATND